MASSTSGSGRFAGPFALAGAAALLAAAGFEVFRPDGTYFVTVGLASTGGRLFHVQTQRYLLQVPDDVHVPTRLEVAPSATVEEL